MWLIFCLELIKNCKYFKNSKCWMKFFKAKSSTVPEYRWKTEQNRYWSQVRKYQNISFPIFHVDFWQIRPWNQTVGYQPNLNNKQNRGFCKVSVRLWNFFNDGSNQRSVNLDTNSKVFIWTKKRTKIFLTLLHYFFDWTSFYRPGQKY